MRKPVVLITGANGEIGHGLIARLAAQGTRAIVTLDVTPLDPALAGTVQRERGQRPVHPLGGLGLLGDIRPRADTGIHARDPSR